MRSLGLHIHRVERLTAGHEQAVALAPAETQVRAALGQHDLTDAITIGGKDVHAVKTLTAPTSSRPDIASAIGANTVRHPLHPLKDHAGKSAAVPQALAIHDIPDGDLAGMIRIVCYPRVDDVEFLIVRGETEAVGFRQRVGDERERCSMGIDAIDSLLEREFPLGAFVVHEAPIARISEPDATVGMHDHVVWGIERFALITIRQHGDAAVILGASQPARTMLARDETP